MNADGSGQRTLTGNRSSASPGAWSPDGRTIVFSSGRDGNGEIYAMNADGSGDRSLSRNGVRFIIPFAWSPALPKRS